jgi:uncharacterized protein YjiS (DUF1127 family)
MTHLRRIPSDLEDEDLQSPRYGALVPIGTVAGRGRLSPTVLSAAHGLVGMLLRHCRQTIEARRALLRLMQLDDRMLKDIGLSRGEVRFGDFQALVRRRQSLSRGTRP